jgi:CDP-2,3-bis-(O-geranylgeranyl)-sn-glycerol synthase
MDLVAIVVEALKLIFPAYCANAAPVLVGGGLPLDFEKNFTDGRRIFGKNKTFRGFFFGLAIGLLVGIVEVFLFNYPILFIVLSPLGALLGDLTGAFLKRRLSIPPGGLLPIVDQVDFVVGAIVFTFPLQIVSLSVAVAMLIITPPIHLLTNFAAYKLRLKSNPW